MIKAVAVGQAEAMSSELHSKIFGIMCKIQFEIDHKPLSVKETL